MSKQKSRLGRGLSSLLSIPSADDAVAENSSTGVAVKPLPLSVAATTAADSTPGLFHVELSRIRPNPDQPRKVFDETRLAELATSIKSAGLVQPLIVRAVEGGYELIAGERRWRAGILAGVGHLPAIVRQVSGGERAELALIENIHRQDLNPIERALAYQGLMTEFGLTQEALAERLGEERSSVANFVRLLELSQQVRELLIEQKLSMGHGKVLAGIPELERQERLAFAAVNGGWSVRALELQIRTAPSQTARKIEVPHLLDLQRRLSQNLEMRVQVRPLGNGGKGSMVIHYANLDQFDALMTRLGLPPEE